MTKDRSSGIHGRGLQQTDDTPEDGLRKGPPYIRSKRSTTISKAPEGMHVGCVWLALRESEEKYLIILYVGNNSEGCTHSTY